jgi:glycosyltransferase involved in cell wall biosynthesis
VLTGKMDRVRVAHLIYGFRLGGLERMVMQLVTRARPLGIEPLLIAFGDDGPVRPLMERDSIPVRWIDNVRGLSWPMLRRLVKAMDEFGPDVLHAHDLGPWLNAAACRVARPRMKLCATFHQLKMPVGRMRPAATMAARVSSALVACGGEVRRELESWLPKRTRLETIPNGAPLPPPPTDQGRLRARRALGIPPTAIAVGYLGRMDEEKQPHLLLDLFLHRFAGRPDVHLALIGGGPLHSQLVARTEGESNVHAVGEIPTGASELLEALDVYAQPSRREGRSMAMLEAMAAGLPTVAHDLPAIREMHSPDSALLVPVGDSAGFGAALEELVNAENRRRAMGRAARQLSQRYSIDDMVARYAALYRDFAQRQAA